MILFFDTETTGLPLRLPPEHPGQPHLVQLAAILAEDDGTERGIFSVIIRPDGWTVPAEAAAVHGIDTATALRVGISLRHAISGFTGMARAASLFVAHNYAFDSLILSAALHRCGAIWEACVVGDASCTMEAAAPILAIPPTPRMLAAGINRPKPPTLAEAYRHFVGRDLVGAHDALVDVRACRDIYFAIKQHAEDAP